MLAIHKYIRHEGLSTSLLTRMWTMKTSQSHAAVVSILDLLERDRLTPDDIAEPAFITTPGSNVFMKAKPLLRLSENTHKADYLCISFKTFMSKRKSFGRLGFDEQCFPFLNEDSNYSFMKLYDVTVIFQNCGKPNAKFRGALHMWRPDEVA